MAFVEQQKAGRLGQFVFWGTVAVILVLLEVAVRARALSPAIYAAPTSIVFAFGDLVARKGLLAHAAATLERTFAAFGIGLLLGTATAAGLFVASRRTRQSAEALIDFLRSIPATALLPLFIAIFGVGNANKIAVGASAALFVVAIGFNAALQAAAARFQTILALYRPSAWTQWVVLLGPAALRPAIATVRIAVSSCLVLVVVGEMFIGSHSGLGYLINDLQYGDNRASQYAAVLASGILGYLLNMTFELARRAVVKRGFDA